MNGKLIAVEGLDGSGKSTQIYLLKRWLEVHNLKVYFTEWNSSELVSEATKRGKKKQTLTPTTFSLIHATDFADRYERQIYPLLQAGYIVLADRYIYTAYARDMVRGCNAQWIRNLYNFVQPPDITFFFDTPPAIALQRILRGRPKLKYFEAGMDLNLSPDEQESFRLFQGKIYDTYKSLIDSEDFTVIDGILPIETQQSLVRNVVESTLDLTLFKSQLNE